MLTPPSGLFVGLATLDVVSLVPRMPRSNEKMAPLEQIVVAGGPATNAAVAFSELGGTATLATVVGRHHVTALAREELATHRVQVLDLDHDPGLHLPLVTVLVEAGSGARTAISPGAGGFGEVGDVPADALDGVDVLLVDGHLLAAARSAARAARERGVPVVLDAGSWKPGLEELLPYVDVAVCSEVFRPPGLGTLQETLDRLAGAGIPDVAATRGHRPILRKTPGGLEEIPVPSIDAVDTLAAGDVFHGALAWVLARGASFDEGLECAAEIAALSCRFFGPRAWIEHLGELSALRETLGGRNGRVCRPPVRLPD